MLIQDGPHHGWIYFNLTDLAPITEDHAKDAQAEAGYPVAGYGFYNFHVSQDSRGHYNAEWRCADSAGN